MLLKAIRLAMLKGASILPMLRACGAEVVGTYLLVVFGTGAVAAAVLTGAQSGIWQVAVVWGSASPSPSR